MATAKTATRAITSATAIANKAAIASSTAAQTAAKAAAAKTTATRSKDSKTAQANKAAVDAANAAAAAKEAAAKASAGSSASRDQSGEAVREIAPALSGSNVAVSISITQSQVKDRIDQSAAEAIQNLEDIKNTLEATMVEGRERRSKAEAAIQEEYTELRGTLTIVDAETGIDISNVTGEVGADVGKHGEGSIWDELLDWLTYWIVQPILLFIYDLISGFTILSSSFRRLSYSARSFLGRVTDKFIDTISAAWSNAWEMVIDTSKVIYDYIASTVFYIGQIIDTKIEEARQWIENVRIEIKEWTVNLVTHLISPYINIWLWLKNNWPGVYTLLSDPVEFIKVALENFKYFITAIIFTPLLELIDDLWGD